MKMVKMMILAMVMLVMNITLANEKVGDENDENGDEYDT